MDLQVSTEMSIAVSEDGVSSEVVAEEQLYCLCQTPWDIHNRRFMIHCDHCQNWYHGDCVGINEKESSWIEIYNCPRCEKIAGPSKYKTKFDHDGNRKLMNKRYSPEYQRRLQEFTFLPADEVVIQKSSGNELKVNELIAKGFFRPIIVNNMDGLGLRLPPSTFTIRDVERYLEPERMVDVIDVEQQSECRMNFREFANYFTDADRKRLLNLISLEVSNTKLGNLIETPYLSRKLDFLNAYWPDDAMIPDGPVSKPAVTKYCLISAKDSYTDFHIDFGGTSVWYHVLWGQKVFFLIEPTKVNLDLYNQWLRGDFGNECFLPDEVQHCYRCVLNKGQTLFIPTGWIHAVYTPHDSLVFGGNFLHKLNMGLQLQIHAMERKSAIAAKYLFPNFETAHWYASKGLLYDLRKNHKKVVPSHILQGLRDLIKTLKAWLDDFDTKKENIPVDLDPHEIVKALYKQVKVAEKFSQRLNDKSLDGSPKLIIKAGSLHLSSTDELSKSSADANFGTTDTLTSNSPLGLGSPDGQVRIKMKISRKSVEDWSPSDQAPGESESRHVLKDGSALSRLLASDDESKDSFECLYIDETQADKKFSCKWDTDSSIVSSESRHSKSHKKHRRHKSKHKKKEIDKHKHKHKGGTKDGTKLSTSIGKDYHSGSKNKLSKSKGLSLNDALAGALDGMEELFKSSNYTERVAQSDNMTDAVKESVVGLGSMTDSILAKNDGEDLDLKQVHQDDDYIYLPLVASDDERSCRKKKKKRSREDDDETWSPTGKLGNVGSRNSKAPRHHAKRKAIEKGLEEAASRPLKIKRSQLSLSPSKKSFKKKSCDSPKKPKAGPSRQPSSSQQSTSSLSSADASKANANNKKWKKGMQTPKQRLSKILKMGKFFGH